MNTCSAIMKVCFLRIPNVFSSSQSLSKATEQPPECRSCFFSCLTSHHTNKLFFCTCENKFTTVDLGCYVYTCNKHLCLSLQSKKHANKVRRYLSIQSEKEPALKKLKSSPSVSKKFSVFAVNVSRTQTAYLQTTHSNQHLVFCYHKLKTTAL